MSIVRVEKSKNYTVMTNYHLRDKRLSLKAKGLMSYMLSLPDEWDFSIKGLSACLPEGKDAIVSGLKELETCGYLVREQVRNQGKFFKFDYTLLEKPNAGNQNAGNQNAENSNAGNPPQINTNKANTKKVNTKEVNTKAVAVDCSPKLAQAMNDFADMRKQMKKPMTGRAKELLLKKLEKLSHGDEEIKIAILEQSIVNGWLGIYELKSDSGRDAPKRGGGIEDMQEMYEDAVRAYKEMGFDG